MQLHEIQHISTSFCIGLHGGVHRALLPLQFHRAAMPGQGHVMHLAPLSYPSRSNCSSFSTPPFFAFAGRNTIAFSLPHCSVQTPILAGSWPFLFLLLIVMLTKAVCNTFLSEFCRSELRFPEAQTVNSSLVCMRN